MCPKLAKLAGIVAFVNFDFSVEGLSTLISANEREKRVKIVRIKVF